MEAGRPQGILLNSHITDYYSILHSLQTIKKYIIDSHVYDQFQTDADKLIKSVNLLVCPQ